MKIALPICALLVFATISQAAIEFSDDQVTDAAVANNGITILNGGMNSNGASSTSGTTNGQTLAAVASGGQGQSAIGSTRPSVNAASATVGTPGETIPDDGEPGDDGDGQDSGNNGDDPNDDDDGSDTGDDPGAAAVPEPTTFIVWSILALCGLGFVRIRKK